MTEKFWVGADRNTLSQGKNVYKIKNGFAVVDDDEDIKTIRAAGFMTQTEALQAGVIPTSVLMSDEPNQPDVKDKKAKK